MYGAIAKIKFFLKSDTSGAVTPEWTVLTGLLVAMGASMGTVSAGIHIAANAIESTVELPANGSTTAFGTPSLATGQ